MFDIIVRIISLFCTGTDMIFICLLFDLLTSQKENDDSKPSQKAKGNKGTGVHSTQTVAWAIH